MSRRRNRLSWSPHAKRCANGSRRSRAAAAGFFTAADRAAKLREELAAIEGEQAVHAAALAAATDVATAARLVGWPAGQVARGCPARAVPACPRAGTADTAAGEGSAS